MKYLHIPTFCIKILKDDLKYKASFFFHAISFPPLQLQTESKLIYRFADLGAQDEEFAWS